MASSSLRLMFCKGDFLALKVLVIAEYAGVEVKQQDVSEAKQEERLLPVLQTPKGTIWESTAIARYVARLRADSGLYGSTLFESAQVDQWVEFCATELEVPTACLASNKVTDRAVTDVKKCLEILDKHLCKHNFMVGDGGVTMADVCVAVVVIQAKTGNGQIDEYIRKSCPHLLRWLDTCTNQKQFKKHLAAFSPDSKAVAGGSKAKTTKEADEGNDDEEDPAKKVPNDHMNLDEWKRTYSNSRDLYGIAMPWLWEHIDSEGWSFWRMKYEKLKDECTVAFLTSNMLNGFLQRMEPGVRKNSFAVIDVVEEGKGAKGFDIKGVWMVRGQEILKELQEHPSYEYYTFEKLSPITNEQHKKLVEAYWCAYKFVEDLSIVDSKVWK